MTYRTLVHVLYIENRQGDTHYGQNENIEPGVLTLETIFKGYPYKVHQVLDNHCSQSHTQANNHCQDVEKTVTLQIPDLEIIKPCYEIFFRHGMTKITF